jgi:hypothetical protein
MAEGSPNQDIAAKVGFCETTVGTLRKRLVDLRLAGIRDLPRCGPPCKMGDEQIEALMETSFQTQGCDSLAPAKWQRTLDFHMTRFRASGGRSD